MSAVSSDLANALIGRLEEADSPYRAWAAVALLSGVSTYRAIGKRIAVDLADAMPAADELQHADVAAYALLDGIGFLSPAQRDRLDEAIPLPHADRNERARLYASSPYLYMLARGIGRRVAWTADLRRILDEELRSLGDCPAPDLVDLMLLLAARLEIREGVPIQDDTLRRAGARISAADMSREWAVSVQWFLELYDSALPLEDDGTALRQAAAAYVGRSAAAPAVADHRLALIAMQLEMASRSDPELRVVSRADEERAIGSRLGRRRVVEGAAYLFAIAVLTTAPMYFLWDAGRISAMVAWAGVVGSAVPAAVFALLIVCGKQRDTVGLGVGFTVGFAYWGLAIAAGAQQRSALLDHLEGESAIIEMIVVTATSFWAGVKGYRAR